jgi:hypothetical protein
MRLELFGRRKAAAAEGRVASAPGGAASQKGAGAARLEPALAASGGPAR